jgi:hypothetical protein
MTSTNKHEMDRREFLERAGAAGLAIGAGGWLASNVSGGEPVGAAPGKKAAANGKIVTGFRFPEDQAANAAPVQWAAGRLKQSLTARGITVYEERPSPASKSDLCIVAAGAALPWTRQTLQDAKVVLPDVADSLVIMPAKLDQRQVLLAGGRDARGIAYALTELADRVDHADDPFAALAINQPIVQKPANVMRSVTRLFSSIVEDKSWFYDRTFWERYFSVLAAQRFNRFSLMFGLSYDFTTNISDCYFHFAYPFLLNPKGYNVRAVGLPDEERDRNLETLKWVSQTAEDHGIQFHLGLWTHAYQWTNSPNANYTIEGLNTENHAPYCRDAVRALLEACPAIRGVTIRTHGESGVAEGNYDFWKYVFEGVAGCGRKVEIDLHAKGIDHTMVEGAMSTGLPVNLSCKYWAEHMGLGYHQANIRTLEKPPANKKDAGFFSLSSGSRSFMRYGYGDLLAEDRKYGVFYRIWPGTQRLLLWGDPAMAAAYSRTASFCGSLGAEWFEPLSFKGRKGSGLPGGRDAYADQTLKPAYDFEKYLYSYRLWGRLLYDPDTDPETWRRSLRKQFGPGAAAVESALAHSSRILPLLTTAHLPSAANNNYWPEIYSDHSICEPIRANSYSDTPSPKRFGMVSPIDPELFSRIDDFAEELLQEKPSGKYSPAQVAKWLEDLSSKAAKDLAEAESLATGKDQPGFRRLAIDVAIQSGLGRFFAWKIRAGLLYALFDRTGDRSAFDEALKAYRQARTIWAELAKRAEGVYVNNITFGQDRHLRGHWSDRLAGIDQNIADMENRSKQKPAAAAGARSAERMAELIRAVLTPADHPKMQFRHEPAHSFQPGEPLAVEAVLESNNSSLMQIRLHYRHVNQAENYQVADMEPNGKQYRATIPAAYTQSPFPLQYYFELRAGQDHAWYEPDLGPQFDRQPYYVARQARREKT